MLKEPIELTLYDGNNEEIETFKLMIIRWGFLKKALTLAKQIKEAEAEEQFDTIGKLICEIYGNRFSLDDLNEKGDRDQVMAVFNAITMVAAKQIPNA